MSETETAMDSRIHEDTALFREAVSFTSAETRFLPRLIEKDYFCTILIEYLSSNVERLVFKGGTCLAKVHAGFYRLSGDLDFVIPVHLSASRSDRRNLAACLKKAVTELPNRLNPFYMIEALKGANDSTQYIAVVGYSSRIGSREETIKIEIGLREPLLTGAIEGSAQNGFSSSG
jgi:hypothetical protein